MKWYATLKWEAIADFKHLRRIVVPTLGVWGLMMVLSLFMPQGFNVLWLMYLPIALAGVYMGVFYPFQSTDGYIKRWRVTEMLSGRPAYVFAIVRFANNIIVSAIGVGFLYMGSIALHRLEITWIDFLPHLLMMDDVFYDFSFGRVLGMVYVLAVLLPTMGLLWNAAVYSANRRLAVASLGSVFFPFLLLFFFIGFFYPESPFFEGGQISIVEVLILAGLAISPIANVAIGSWLLDKKTDFGG